MCRFGFREPKPSVPEYAARDCIDVVLVPGIAFDSANHRLGRGCGYYDRFLASLSRDTTRIGAAFDFQILPDIPYEEHDQPVDSVVSNS